jgi:hypothetical protein
MLRLRPRPDAIEAPLGHAAEDALSAAYAYLQIWIGLVAFTMPIVLVLGNWALGGSTQGSISAYYYTKVGAWFIGSQFVLGVFFLSYNYRPLPRYKWDNIWSNVACVAMIIVAVIPTKQPGTEGSFGSTCHLVAAGLVFVLLAYFAFFRFTMSKEGATITSKKRQRNVLYRVCGGIIAVAIVLLLLGAVAIDEPKSWHAVLVLESIAIFAFGVSWLVKGGFLGILADR